MPDPTAIPALPENAPFSPEQRAWLNGFLAGVFYDHGGPGSAASAGAAPVAPKLPLLVAFGSQTGSAQGLAKRFAKEAETRGFATRVKELNAVSLADLAAEARAVLITSTWGDGDAPDNAAAFWAGLSADTAPRLEGLSFAVLGLGDKNYADFCGAAKKFDDRLAHLGAKRIVPRAECDVDYEAAAKAWIESLWPAMAEVSGPQIVTAKSADAPVAQPATCNLQPLQPLGRGRLHSRHG